MSRVLCKHSWLSGQEANGILLSLPILLYLISSTLLRGTSTVHSSSSTGIHLYQTQYYSHLPYDDHTTTSFPHLIVLPYSRNPNREMALVLV